MLINEDVENPCECGLVGDNTRESRLVTGVGIRVPGRGGQCCCSAGPPPSPAAMRSRRRCRLGGVGGGKPQAGDSHAPQAVTGHGRGRQRLVARQDGLQLLGVGDPQVRDTTPARPAGGGELDSKQQDVAAEIAGDALRPVAPGMPEGADVATPTPSRTLRHHRRRRLGISGYSQSDVMSGAELGVHAARRAALRRRIRDL